MKKLVCLALVLGYGVFAISGCSSGGENKPADSMADILSEGKKAQGITDTSVKSKDSDAGQKKADPNAPTPETKPGGDDKGSGSGSAN
jgi:hypothetical protein